MVGILMIPQKRSVQPLSPDSTGHTGRRTGVGSPETVVVMMPYVLDSREVVVVEYSIEPVISVVIVVGVPPGGVVVMGTVSPKVWSVVVREIIDGDGWVWDDAEGILNGGRDIEEEDGAPLLLPVLEMEGPGELSVGS
jgi:hypothetical protein